MSKFLASLARRAAFGVACSTALAACHKSTTTAAADVTPVLTAVASSLNQSGTVGQALPSPLAVRVTNAGGTPLAGITVTFNVTTGGGSLNQLSTTTDASGNASVVLTLGTKVGVDSVAATATNGNAVSFAATAVAGAPAQLIAVSQDSVAVPVGTPTTIVVKAVDVYGNPVANAQLSWTADNGATVTAASQATGVDGTLALTVTDRAQATIDVIVSLANDPVVMQSFTVVDQ